MKEFSVLEWNINQRGGWGRSGMPSWLLEETAGTDIIILTEFSGDAQSRSALIRHLEETGYHCAASENSGGNDVLISSRRPILRSDWVPCYGRDTIPENLRVDLDCDGEMLAVMGVRIKSLDRDPQKYGKRREAFRWVLDQFKEESLSVLIAGDFNNNRRESIEPTWNLRVMDQMMQNAGWVRYTPEGSSIYEEKSWKASHEFPYDHFLARGASVRECSYDRDFTAHHAPYNCCEALGRNFREPWYPGAQVRMLKAVKPPYPDHAILRGTISL